MGLLHGPRAYPKIYEKYYDRFNIYDDRAAWEASIESIPLAAVHLWSIHWLHLEVYNGGFWQFFANSTGVLAFEARDGFAVIEMPEVANVIRRAMEKLGEPYLVERKDRLKKLEELEKLDVNWDKEDTDFYNLADTEKLFRRVPKFVPFADAYAYAYAQKHLGLGKGS